MQRRRELSYETAQEENEQLNSTVQRQSSEIQTLKSMLAALREPGDTSPEFYQICAQLYMQQADAADLHMMISNWKQQCSHSPVPMPIVRTQPPPIANSYGQQPGGCTPSKQFPDQLQDTLILPAEVVGDPLKRTAAATQRTVATASYFSAVQQWEAANVEPRMANSAAAASKRLKIGPTEGACYPSPFNSNVLAQPYLDPLSGLATAGGCPQMSNCCTKTAYTGSVQGFCNRCGAARCDALYQQAALNIVYRPLCESDGSESQNPSARLAADTVEVTKRTDCIINTHSTDNLLNVLTTDNSRSSHESSRRVAPLETDLIFEDMFTPGTYSKSSRESQVAPAEPDLDLDMFELEFLESGNGASSIPALPWGNGTGSSKTLPEEGERA